MEHEKIKKRIISGAVFIYPTDTIYGIGCDATNPKAVARIYEIKKREGKKPLSVIMGNFEMIEDYCELSTEQKNILINCLPGPFTFILKLKSGKELPVTDKKIGVRVPEHQFARRLSAELGIPIVTTSANISGKKDASKASDIDKEVAGAVDFTIDTGETKYKQGSTVVDLIEMKVLRKGAGMLDVEPREEKKPKERNKARKE